MYFNKIPEILYNFRVGDKEPIFIVKDITTNVRVVKEILENITLYDEYDIKDGETPEIISNKLYGSPLYHWAIMIVNEKYDYIADFPQTYDRLEQFCKDKYGADAIYDIHHYEDSEGYIINSDTPGAVSVSNIGYEETVNESKRRIKIVDKTILQQILNEFDQLVK